MIYSIPKDLLTHANIWTQASYIYLHMAMQSCIQTHSCFRISLFHSLGVFPHFSPPRHPDCISTFIWNLQKCITFLCYAFLTLRGGKTRRFLQREDRIADSSPLLNSRPVLWATTLPPPCLSEHLFAMQISLFCFFVFFCHSRSSQASSLSKK